MRPRILDAFCGAGGAGEGYHRAGFEVVGVDIKPQPNYPFEFVQADALEFLRDLEGFDAIHASPPCQAHSTIGKQARGRDATLHHADHIDATRAALCASGLPYVIENVPGAPLRNAVMLCGSSFGLNVRRHRLFESNVPIMALPCAHHWQTPRFRSLDKRRGDKVAGLSDGLASVVGVHGHHNYAGERALREWAMDIDWMSPYELTQAIPPAYTEHIGGFLMAEVNARLVASTPSSPRERQ
jgi:DNA (cytosine-5)-methyltransferase 1